ncbi:sensor histidine kinase [Marinospirillum sp.]|uniref:sensor histidine kinase n=1 Tax=Marinospirillum sp. TaxID=2183934 RepID=UPI003A8A29CA
MSNPAVSLKKLYLRRMLPALLLVLVFFIAEMLYQQLHNQRALQDQSMQIQIEQTARLLEEPVWRFSDSVIQSILTRLYQEEVVLCVRLEHARDLRQPIELGRCDSQVAGTREYRRAVIYQAAGGPRELAQLSVWAASSFSLSALVREIFYSLLLTLLIFAVFAFFTLRTFQNMILRPLRAFSRSLRHYQVTGEKQAVNWQSPDELGQLIHEYNQSLQIQAEAEERTHRAREAAEQALAQLKQAQESLIQSEKLASLGGLVAGVAHEINTPVGNSVTVATTMLDHTDSLSKKVAAGELTRSDLQLYLELMQDAGQLLYRNVQKAADLIQHFKQVAVDQTSAQRRRFDLAKTLEEVIYTLKPQLKSTPHRIQLDLVPQVQMDSYPGPLGQVISNLVSNALIHAFSDQQPGVITIRMEPQQEGERVLIWVEDTGQGMPPEMLSKAFDPFFTTKLGQGGSGLGLHIVYNLVQGVLGGEISVTHPAGQGLVFRLLLPLVAPDKKSTGEHAS